MDSDTILKIVQTIQTSGKLNKAEHFAARYPEFKDKYAALFEMACSEQKVDMQNLVYMMEMLDKMKESNLSQYDASAKVGQMLFDKYIEPNMDKMEKKK
jgi:hypothetical protein